MPCRKLKRSRPPLSKVSTSVYFIAVRIFPSLNVLFNKNMERMIFNTSFVSVHGKDLVEEIKSETSGDLQTTLIKLAEV